MSSTKNQNSISFVFTGDIGFDRYMDGKWKDPQFLSEEVLDFLHSGDHIVANVEGPIVDLPKNEETSGTAQLLHTMGPEVTGFLASIGADIWNLCNNHMMDAGEAGLSATLQEAEKAGARTIGAGMCLADAMKPLYFEEAGGIGMFAVGYRRGCKPAAEDHGGCFLWNEEELIRQVIAEIKSRCRWCVMVVHGGEEFTALPSPYTRDRYLRFLEMGADVLVCHHPHVPMNYEKIGDKMIFYSLGNFIFDTDYQRAQYHTEEGVLLNLSFTEDAFQFTPCGIRIVRGEERIVRDALPAIFQDVPGQEYELLAPLAAKMFIAATKRQQIYLNPGKFRDATDDVWAEHFADPKRSGRVVGEGLDFFIICPLAEKEAEKAWEKSTLTEVRDYILGQM